MIKNITNSAIAIAKVASKGIFKHIIFIGFSLIIFIIAAILVGTTEGPGLSASGHAGILGAIFGIFFLFSIDFWPMLLCVTSLVLFPFLYFTVINKGIIHAVLFQLWKQNLKQWFMNKISGYTNKYFSGENNISKINDLATVKVKLISDIKNDKTNSLWQRKILSFILKKVKLDEFEANKPENKISDFLVLKATNFVEDLGKPSSKPLFIVFGAHVVLIVFAFMFNK